MGETLVLIVNYNFRLHEIISDIYKISPRIWNPDINKLIIDTKTGILYLHVTRVSSTKDSTATLE